MVRVLAKTPLTGLETKTARIPRVYFVSLRLPSIRINILVGSLVLRDMRAWHRGMLNTIDSPRTMLALIYSRGWMADSSTLEIPQAVWDGWPERARLIFRGNQIIAC